MVSTILDKMASNLNDDQWKNLNFYKGDKVFKVMKQRDVVYPYPYLDS